MRRRMYVLALALVVTLVSASAALADPRISATAVINADRSISVSWNVPAGSFGGSFIVNPLPTTDFTGELPFDSVGDTTIDYNLLQAGWTTYQTLPLDMTITQPTTIYAQVTLIDPFGDGSCSQGSFGANCDSQVIPLVVQPICSQVLVTQGYYTTSLVSRGHYLKHNGHRVRWSSRYRHPKYAKRNGWVWVKAVYKRVFHPPVYQTECH